MSHLVGCAISYCITRQSIRKGFACASSFGNDVADFYQGVQAERQEQPGLLILDSKNSSTEEFFCRAVALEKIRRIFGI